MSFFKTTKTLCAVVSRDPIMGRATRGLYHGKHILFGNNRAHSERKTRRTWKPNVQTHNYKSDVLSKNFKIRLTTKAMKCIDKAGGFDNYIMKTNTVWFGGENSLGGRLQDAMFRISLNDALRASKKSNQKIVRVNQDQVDREAAHAAANVTKEE